LLKFLPALNADLRAQGHDVGDGGGVEASTSRAADEPEPNNEAAPPTPKKKAKVAGKKSKKANIEVTSDEEESE
jgi:hypothetical protein